jgi:hypothetical protein
LILLDVREELRRAELATQDEGDTKGEHESNSNHPPRAVVQRKHHIEAIICPDFESRSHDTSA